jgi:proteasome activator subunit 4
MYCKIGVAEMGVILQNLATLRPEIVIPPLVERLYLAFETLTEPHKLTATMHAVVSVSR